MGTHVTYNGVKLYNVLTREWSEEMVYDDSGTDILYHRYHLKFEALVHSLAVSSSEPVGATRTLGAVGTLQDRYEDIRIALGQARREFYVMMTDSAGNWFTVLKTLPATAVTSSRFADVDEGPKPRNVTVTHIAGLQCWRVSFAIDVCLADCAGVSAVPMTLSNRWSVSEEMDDNGFTTRTFAGRLRLAFAEALAVKMPSYAPWRRLVVPSLEYGFKRDRLEFSVSANGLDCDYRVVDRQVHTAAPWPATKLEMTHTEATGDGLSVTSECTVRLEGPPHVDKRFLLMRAIHCIDSRLNFLAALKDKDKPRFYVEDGRVVDHVGERNLIEVSLRLHQVPEKGKVLSFLENVAGERLGAPLKVPDMRGQPESYSTQKSPLLDVYGYTPSGESRVAVLAVLACYLQEPCGSHQSPQPSVQATRIVQRPPSSTGDPPGAYSDQLSTGYDRLSDATREAAYTHCALHNEYSTNQCRVVLPKAFQPGDQTAENPESDTVAVFRLGLGICYRRIVFDAERIGKWPQIPEPVDTYANETLKGTLISSHVSPHSPTLASDRDTAVYRIHGELLYVLNRPITRKDKVNTCVLPFIKAELVDTLWEPNITYNRYLGP